MAIWRVDGETQHADVRDQRINAGTIGGEHAVPKGLASGVHNAIIDDQDPRVVYGGTINQGASLGFAQNGTQSVLNDFLSTTGGTTVSMSFVGTSIGVLGGTNPYSGIISIYIDGFLSSGRMPAFVSLDETFGGANSYALSPSNTTVHTLSIPVAFPASGTILIGKELISYAGIAGDRKSFTGCTRGVGGTAALPHYGYETVYSWNSSTDLGTTTDFATKRLLYYNQFLSPGSHTITIVTSVGSTGYASFYFDGFVTGSLIGAKNMFTQLGTITLPITTDANGHSNIGTIAANNFDISPIAILGISQDNTTTSNTTQLGKLGVTFGTSGQPSFYLHNGPPSVAFNLTITFMYIGESL